MVIEQLTNPIIAVEDNKLKLSKDAMNLLQVSTNDRIAVNYFTVSPEETFPVVGKAEIFTDQNGGNRITKSNTVSFRGSQRDILLEYGKLFKLIPFKNYFKMEAINKESDNDTLDEEEQYLNNLQEKI